MAVNYNATLKTARMQLMADLVASKTAAAATGTALAGQLIIGTSGLVSGTGTGVLATIPLNATAFTVSGGVATLSVAPPLAANASASGTAAKGEIRNNAGAMVVDGLTVGLSGSDINLTSLAITSGQQVSVTSGSITHS